MAGDLRWVPPVRKWWIVIRWRGVCEQCGAPVMGCGREEVFRPPTGPVRCLWCVLSTDLGNGLNGGEGDGEGESGE